MPVGRFDSFWSQINDEGISKNSHWDAVINLPPSLQGTVYAGIERTLAFRCEAGELPGRQLVTNDVKIYGPIYRTPYQSLYAELNLTFLDTAELKIRQFMEAWMNTIFNAESNLLQYQDTYLTSMILTQYHLEAREQTKVTRPELGDFRTVNVQNPTPAGLDPSMFVYVHRAYPVNINQMSTAWSDDSAHRVQVTFFYEWYTISASPRSTLGSYRGVPEPKRSIDLPVGLDDTAQAWFSQTKKI